VEVLFIGPVEEEAVDGNNLRVMVVSVAVAAVEQLPEAQEVLVELVEDQH
jgi:hypothetical protein